jgi:thiol-disulfide isomerase/thioredoxin
MSQYDIQNQLLTIEIQKFNRDSGSYTVIKKIKVVKNNFNVIIPVISPIECKLYLKKNDTSINDSPPFYITNEPILISIDSLNITVKSKQNDFFQKHMLVYLSMPAIIVNDPNFSTGLLKQSYELALFPRRKYFMLELKIKEYENDIISTVKENKEYYCTLVSLYGIRDELTPKTLESCFEILKEQWEGTILLKKLKEYIIKSKKLFVGNTLPVFKVKDENLTKYHSKDFLLKKQFTFIDFWASWCVPCRAQTKELKKLFTNIDTMRMQIVSISIDDNIFNWKKSIIKDSITWKNYVDEGGWAGNAAKNLNITFLPYNFLVDQNGKILDINIARDDLKNFLMDNNLFRENNN